MTPSIRPGNKSPEELAEDVLAGTFPSSFEDLDDAAEAALAELVRRAKLAPASPASAGRQEGEENA